MQGERVPNQVHAGAHDHVAIPTERATAQLGQVPMLTEARASPACTKRPRLHQKSGLIRRYDAKPVGRQCFEQHRERLGTLAEKRWRQDRTVRSGTPS